jgi:hypothetical protein
MVLCSLLLARILSKLCWEDRRHTNVEECIITQQGVEAGRKRMSEKPGKRLVSKWEYVRVTAVRTLVGSGFMFSVILGSLTLFPTISCFMWGQAFGVVFWGSWTACFLAIAVSFYKKSEKIKHVAPITRHNTGHLPEVETLVRAADLSPSHQQAELLRAAKPGQETPAEELLRATSGQNTGKE